uniref:Amyloid beta A4 protein n=2 Tax=Bursaphelenchus xylophilus TaxID=6326 RepID=A0A1I7SJ11_BURXY
DSYEGDYTAEEEYQPLHNYEGPPQILPEDVEATTTDMEL